MRPIITGNIVAIIDADMLRYSCGFSIEKRDKETDILYVEPVKHAYYNINSIIKKVLKRCETGNYRCILTKPGDKTNFRFDIYKYYKENRVSCASECGDPHPYNCNEKYGHALTGHKPIYFKECHDFIVKRWKAEETQGQEADDAITMIHIALNPFGFEEKVVNSIICSLDKDFNTVPGWHYNWKRDEFWFVSEVQAKRNFYLQLLTGDTSDNIPRVQKGWLKAKTEKKLNEAKDEIQMLDITKEAVYDVFKKSGVLDINTKVDEFILRNGRLCYLRTKENELWVPPTQDEILLTK